MGLGRLPYATQSRGYWSLEWAFVRRSANNHDPEVEHNSEDSESDEDTRHRGIDGRHVFAQAAGEEEKGSLEHDREALDEEVEGPLLEPIALALAVTATLDHRPARVPQVSVEPLLPQHRDECGKQRDHQTSVHESGDRDDLGGRIFLGGWNGGGLIRDGGLIEGEENCAEESRGLLVRIGLEARVDIDDEGGTDGGEKTRLQRLVR